MLDSLLLGAGALLDPLMLLSVLGGVMAGTLIGCCPG